MSAVSVWVSDWEIKCCGAPFALGVAREFSLAPVQDVDWFNNIFGAGSPLLPDMTEELHAEPETPIRTVTARPSRIRLVQVRYAPAPGRGERFLEPVAGSAELIDLSESAGWDAENPGFTLAGYLIEIDLGG